MIKIKNNIIEIILLFGLLLVLFYSTDPIIYPDTKRYLSQNLHDPPLYSVMIYLLKSTFGNLNSVIIFQSFIIVIGIIYFLKTVTVHFELSLAVKFIIAFFLFVPILQFYRNLLPEPISYALSLLFISFAIKLIYKLNYLNLIYFTIFVILLLLVRNQFIFLYPLILFFFSCILFLNSSKKKLILLILSFFSVIIFNSALINLNKNINKKPTKNSIVADDKSIFFFTYIDAIYISTSKDVNLFENQKIRNALTNIIGEMENKKKLMKYYNNRGHYSLSFKEIRNYSRDVLEDLALDENININNLKKEISIKLITANFKKYIKHIFKKFYDSTWLFVFIPFFMMLASLSRFTKYKSKYSLVILFLSVFTLTNHSIIYLFGRVQPRYFIYTDFILLIFVFITFVIFFKKEKIIFN